MATGDSSAPSGPQFVEFEDEDRYGRTELRPPKDYGTSAMGPAHQAASKNDEEELASLIKTVPSSLEVQAKCGWTPLHFAARNGHVEAVNLLIGARCNLEAVDRRRSTPFHRAAHSGHPAVLQALLDAGANMNATDSNGQTALHVAAGSGRSEAVDFLLDCGMSQNARDGPLCDCMTAEEVARAAQEDEVAALLHARQLRRVNWSGGASYLVPAGHPLLRE